MIKIKKDDLVMKGSISDLMIESIIVVSRLYWRIKRAYGEEKAEGFINKVFELLKLDTEVMVEEGANNE